MHFTYNWIDLRWVYYIKKYVVQAYQVFVLKDMTIGPRNK